MPWLEGLSLPGIHQIFSRLGLSYKRAREYLRSPDTDYAEKLSRIKQALEEARENPETCVVVYQDEFSFNLQPTVAKDWAETGTKYPLARQSYLPEETCYGIGALNPHTGDVVYQQVKSCTVVALHTFYTQICQRYPNAERIYLIQDNRAIHFHANLRAALLPQTTRFVRPTPPNWSEKPSKKIGKLEKLPIEILQSRRMPVGRIRLRSCGAGRVKPSYICIVSAMTGQSFRRKSSTSWNSSKAGHRSCYTMSDYYRINYLIFIKPRQRGRVLFPKVSTYFRALL